MLDLADSTSPVVLGDLEIPGGPHLMWSVVVRLLAVRKWC